MGGHIPFCTLHKLEAYEANCGLHQLGLHITYTSTFKNLEDLIDAQVLRAPKKGASLMDPEKLQFPDLRELQLRRVSRDASEISFHTKLPKGCSAAQA